MELVLTAIGLILLYLWVVVRHDTHSFVVRNVRVSTPKLKTDLTIVLLSDLHEKDYGRGNEALVRAVSEIKPDIVLSAGDMVTAHHRAKDFRDDAAYALLQALAARYLVYAARGNHETKMAERSAFYGDALSSYEEKLREAGVILLRTGREEKIFDGVDLFAAELDTSYYRHGPAKALPPEMLKQSLPAPDAEHFTLMLMHNPEYFESCAAFGADLTLAGHVHGGIARLFGRGVISPAYRLFPFYDGGVFVRDGKGEIRRQKEGCLLYLEAGARGMVLSRGLGTHTIHVRFNNPGELVVIRLHGTGQREEE